MGTRRTLVTLLKMTVAGAAGAGAALLAGNRLLRFEVDDAGRCAAARSCSAARSGLLVIAAVATCCSRSRSWCRCGTGSPRCSAAFSGADRQPRSVRRRPATRDVQDTGRGTLVVTGSVLSMAPAMSDGHVTTQHLRWQPCRRRPAVRATNHPTSREQVAEPVPNDSGGPTVQGREHDHDTDPDYADVSSRPSRSARCDPTNRRSQQHDPARPR